MEFVKVPVMVLPDTVPSTLAVTLLDAYVRLMKMASPLTLPRMEATDQRRGLLAA